MMSQRISSNIMNQFAMLAIRLSPENLSCDGECTPAETKRRHAAIMREWKALETRYGMQVTLEEAERFAYNS